MQNQNYFQKEAYKKIHLPNSGETYTLFLYEAITTNLCKV